MDKDVQKKSHIHYQLFMIPSTVFFESSQAERN